MFIYYESGRTTKVRFFFESSIQNKVINSQKNPKLCLSDYKKGCRI